MDEPLEQRIAEKTLEYVLDPPVGADPVIEFAPPPELYSIFEDSVGLPLASPQEPCTDDVLVAAIDTVIKYSVHTSHPRFVNQNFAGPDPISVVGDWLGAALNTTGATFEAAPVFTLMESAVLNKLAAIAGYPLGVDSRELPPGLFAPGGSTGTLFALQLARHRHQPDIVHAGSNGDRLCLFVSDSGHYAAIKSAALLGIGTDAVVKVASDRGGAMQPHALRTAIADARKNGMVPFAVIGTSGTTVTSAFDDLNALADVCETEDLWFHVDGCYGGSALFSPSHRHHMSGVDRSDSFVWNLHKMMGMTQQCTALLVKKPSQLEPCFATGANYLFQPDKQHGEFDSGDRTFQCARRIDSLKLWLTWKARGDSGFSERIDHAVAMADHTRTRIDESDGAFAHVVAGDFTNVVFAWIPPEFRPFDPALISEKNRELLHRLPPRVKARMQVEGTAMVGFQPVHGLNTFRMLFMNPSVTINDVDAVLGYIAEYATEAWAGLGAD
ncbi:MAG: pyridoxal phosphate-dependent decarboxylase family protein [Acidimicrobiales bacterium]